MRIDGNGKSAPNYAPNGRGGPVADPRALEAPRPLAGATGRNEYPQLDRADDFELAGLLYRVLSEPERARLIANLAGHLGQASQPVQRRQVAHFARADAEYGARVAEALGHDARATS